MKSDAPYYRFAMKVFADFSGTIAIPAVLAALLGKWLDQKYSTQPRYLVLLLVFAFLSTGFSIRKKAIQYQKEYQKLLNEK